MQYRQRDEDRRCQRRTLDAQHAQTQQEHEEGTQDEACREKGGRRRWQEPDQG
jgi:hypothetical protein